MCMLAYLITACLPSFKKLGFGADVLFLSSQISCHSSSAALSDRTRYKRHFQLLNSHDTLAYAYFGVIKEYGWKHVELIVQDENLFTEVS